MPVLGGVWALYKGVPGGSIASQKTTYSTAQCILSKPRVFTRESYLQLKPTVMDGTWLGVLGYFEQSRVGMAYKAACLIRIIDMFKSLFNLNVSEMGDTIGIAHRYFEL